jgi:hypothetical protein
METPAKEICNVEIEIYDADKTMFLRQAVGNAKYGELEIDISLVNTHTPCIKIGNKFYVFPLKELITSVINNIEGVKNDS